jgi:hypothetical protein
MAQQSPAGPPASPQGWGPPPGQAPTGWAAPPVATKGSVTGLAKLGAMFLFLMGLLFTLLGALLLVAGGMLRSVIEGANVEGLTSQQVADIFGGALVVVAVIVLVFAILEMLVGVFSWRGSGFARVLGILYSLFWGVILLLGSLGGSRVDAATANGQIVTIVFAAAYLYTAIVFIVRYRGRA